ncbi:helix-turn-helix domain-containing protein [Lactovum odontotermitis]
MNKVQTLIEKEVYEGRFVCLNNLDFEAVYQSYLEQEQIEDNFNMRLIASFMYQVGFNRGKRTERQRGKSKPKFARYTFRELRKLRRLSYSQVYLETGIDITDLKRIEKDSSYFHPVVLKKLAVLYDCSLDLIYCGVTP